jgi:tRNA uridine 5-carboxymethylaminomethyl modification enzyme
MDELRIPDHIQYRLLGTLSYEAREKLERIRPQSLGQASRIPGVSPSDLQSLVLEILKQRGAAGPQVSRETIEEAQVSRAKDEAPGFT